MVKTNAERQAEYQKRRKAMLAASVSPDDVRRAIRLLYEDYASEPLNGAKPFEEWVASLAGAKGRGHWIQFVPDSLEGDAYDHFAPDEAALLRKVAAVYQAMKVPPSGG